MKQKFIAISSFGKIRHFFEALSTPENVQIIFYNSLNEALPWIDEQCIGVALNQDHLTLEDLSYWHTIKEKCSVPFIFLSYHRDDQRQLDLLKQLFSIASSEYQIQREHEAISLSPNVIFDPAGKVIWKQGHEYMLTMMEFRLLMYLLTAKECASTIDHIIDRVWGVDAYTTSNTVYVHIRKLREKIEDDPSHPKILVTCHGIGYRLNIFPKNLEVASCEETTALH
ncbi:MULTISPECIES: winged helix-turn-helix domain-containing protein [Paenibacillus]|uniref:Chemotaxis protein CheY n=1 Tax=Paenibacillus polymyxa (strain SC2) TaxID=886882 RepID=E3EGY3_PAEPS|nr:MULTISPECIES: winged-helix domain-containing protein [Paenibacillus]ADO55543.1 chemotaxis protein CheY [Paenibacillus polymyxa SC2]AJE50347.1 chemotaxis protein CheY [Paenibacillus polymyxa]QOH61271.1 DNA-binding response regulator [Paenibacillus polymyxa]WPQ58316.1 winged-helix domain-containing protein [Paenibacillus polymyxa]CCC84360.1 alkaline phosphatase synthesis transcriptional regulatory protein sphR [Paenibacillus polymyxa M1]